MKTRIAFILLSIVFAGILHDTDAYAQQRVSVESKGNNTIVTINNNVDSDDNADEDSEDFTCTEEEKQNGFCIDGSGINADEIPDEDFADNDENADDAGTDPAEDKKDFKTEFKEKCKWHINEHKTDTAVDVEYKDKDNECYINYTTDTISFEDLLRNIDTMINDFDDAKIIKCGAAIYRGNSKWQSTCSGDNGTRFIVFDYDNVYITCDKEYQMFDFGTGKCEENSALKSQENAGSDATPEEPEEEKTEKDDGLFQSDEDSNIITISEFEDKEAKDINEALDIISKSEYKDKIDDDCKDQSNHVICGLKKVSMKDKDKYYKFVFKSIGGVAEPATDGTQVAQAEAPAQESVESAPQKTYNKDQCKKTCTGTKQKCDTENEISWFCITLSDGEYQTEDTCNEKCSKGKCKYKKIKGKAEISYRAFVCTEANDDAPDDTKQLEADAKQIIDAYNKKKKVLENKKA